MLPVVYSMSCTPLLYARELALHPLKGRTTRPCPGPRLFGSFVKALNVCAAGVHAHPSPKLEVPTSDGAVALVTSRYFKETRDEL